MGIANKVEQLEERTLERRRLADELARREAELSERKKQEVGKKNNRP
jgi:hypothetical protein